MTVFDPTPFVTQDEGQHFDRKSLFHGPAGQERSRDRREVRDQVAEFVAAFANAEGGVLILAGMRRVPGLDTVQASQILRRLRDRGHLALHPAGAASFYTLVKTERDGDPDKLDMEPDKLAAEPDKLDTQSDKLDAKPDKLDTKPDNLAAELDKLDTESDKLGGSSDPVAVKLQRLPQPVVSMLDRLGSRPRTEKIKAAILGVSNAQEWTAGELAELFGRHVRYLMETYLGPMVEEGVLRRTRDAPTDPRQGYIATSKGLGPLFDSTEDDR